MTMNEVKAKAFDAIVTAYYGEKLTQTYVEALINFVGQFTVSESDLKETEPVKEEKPKKAETKKPAGAGKKPLDEGKIKALFEGGWSISKIADELGASGPTIKARLVAMGLVK